MQKFCRLGVFLLLALAACKKSDLPTSRRTGIVTVDVAPSGSGYKAGLLAEFYRDRGEVRLPNSKFPADSCQVQAYSALTPGIPTVGNFLSPGDSVTAQSAAGTLYLKPTTTIEGYTTFRPPTGDSLPVSPGATVTISIPGDADGLDAATVTAKTAEPFTIGPIDTMPGTTINDSLHLTWSAGDDSSAMIMQLEYGTGGTLTSQLHCELRDDGQAFVNDSRFLLAWKQATFHHVGAVRLRTAFASLGDQILFAISRFFVNKSTFP